MSGVRPLQLGLVSNNGESWIAGVLYVQAVMQAMAALPEGQRPDMHLWLKRGSDLSLYGGLQSMIRSTHVYDAHHHESLGVALKAHRRCLIRHGCLSRNLVKHASSSGMDLLFPCHQSLGSNAALPWIGWIPDFQHLYLPQLFSDAARNKRDATYRRMALEASHMVVSSETACRDLLDAYAISPDKVSVYRFRTRAEESWFELDAPAVVRKYSLPEKFLIFPSQYWKHKDHLVLFDALALLRDEGVRISLVLTGKDQDYRNPHHAPMLLDHLRRHRLSDQVHHLGLLPRDEQIQLMRCSAAAVQPSRFEGWSMLVEDCRALGKAVILSDIEVHQEQAYAMAHYFPVGDARALAEVIAGLWPSLEAGPDLAIEKQARVENARLTLENGRMLLAMFERVRNS